MEPPGKIPNALRITPSHVEMEAALRSPMVRAARLLLSRAVEKNGLVLTPAGTMKRADVWHVFDQTEWPGYEKSEVLAANKVINEGDAPGVTFTRVTLQARGLLQAGSGILKPSEAAKTLLAPEAAPALLAELFQAVFWKVRLQMFDGIAIDSWPQPHIGVILWSLSVAAHSWCSAEDLTSNCSMVGILGEDPPPDLPEYAMVARALRPLTWLGVMESRQRKGTSRWAFDDDFRKMPLFEQLLRFDIELQGAEGERH